MRAIVPPRQRAVLIAALASLGLASACSSTTTAPHESATTRPARPSGRAPTANQTVTRILSEATRRPELPFRAIYRDLLRARNGRIFSEVVESVHISEGRWFYETTTQVESPQPATSSFTSGLWVTDAGPFLCNRAAAAGPWTCQRYDGAPNGFQDIELEDPPTGLVLGLQNLAEMSQQVSQVGLPLELQAPTGWHLSCLRFTTGKKPLATVCLTASRLIAYFASEASIPGAGGPETVTLESLSTDVTASAERLPAPVTSAALPHS